MAFPQQQHLQADKHSNKPNNYICIFSTTTFLFVFTISMISAMPVQQKTHQRRMQRHIVIRPAQITAPSDNVILAAKAESEADGGEESTRRRHDFAIKYLSDFGHLSTTSPTPRELKAAIESFQYMVGVPTTGVLNRETVDQARQAKTIRYIYINYNLLSEITIVLAFFYNLFEFFIANCHILVYISRWENKMDENNILRLKWYIENYTKDIAKAEIKKIVEKAFNLWSSQVKIQAINSIELAFEEAMNEDEADITILWAEGDHGDAHRFDGPGEDGSNILAHTFYPNYQLKGSLNGDIHFDDYEKWNTDGTKEGASFPHVLVHEIGHTLGLGHSKKQQAIMFPIYRKDHLDLMQLDLDDKCAVNWSYIGASDLCLYIWLLSEVVPKRVSLDTSKKDADVTPAFMVNKNNNDNIGQANNFVQGKEMILQQLRHTALPICSDAASNHVRKHLEDMLVRRLGFPRELANDYTDVVCRFFSALHRAYHLPVTENFHSALRVDGAHSYFQGEEHFEALQRALSLDRQFDTMFLDQILEKFAAGKVQRS